MSIRGEDARYLTRVLRLRAGATLVLFDGRGGEYVSELRAPRRNEVTAHIQSHDPVDRESPLKITLAQGISRGDRMDHVVQKTTELGVSEIVPLSCARGIVRLTSERAASRREHWDRIAIGACQQCGRNRPPRVRSVTAFDDWLAETRPGLVLTPQTPRVLPSIQAPDGAVTILIGPEGGLTDDELTRARDAGLQPIGLGPRVLRTETAAVAAIAVVQSLWGDLS